jgi:hypothetical protein
MTVSQVRVDRIPFGAPPPFFEEYSIFEIENIASYYA